MHPMLNIAIRAARKAGNLIAKNYEIVGSIEINQINNIVINSIKKEIENSIVEIIHKAYPQHTIFTAINGNVYSKNKDIKWVIEPLDCIHNFIKCLPVFSISITLMIKDRNEIAVVYAPILNELFTAVRGQGAQLNGYRLRCGNALELSGTILAIGRFDNTKQYNKEYINKINTIFNDNNIDFRRTGSVGLDMAYVAAGRIDGYFEFGLKPWDFAAGELLIRESGGLITDFTGNNDYKKTGNIIAANINILKALLLNIRKIF
ncbi:inositol-1-monophosphatase [Candidatus Pantoea edessiphila]|uniref:Inositol-1-monophosphatase n=1 Tax=Candidatus Pantoea edessiphila TaxID=2044610 RepID=A0A2P5T2W9_9GAMM|nr:inositol-1-monophosphatase [Candidatus Pantoea edessiphila]PPI88929.1 inositol-1-monophosphatase [Candidatus Pantoea edessiphila]